MPYYYDSSKAHPADGRLESLSPIIGTTERYAVTPSDTVDLPHGVCRAIYADTAGIIYCFARDEDVGGTALPVLMAAGVPQMIHARRIIATGTTATGIQAWY